MPSAFAQIKPAKINLSLFGRYRSRAISYRSADFRVNGAYAACKFHPTIAHVLTSLLLLGRHHLRIIEDEEYRPVV